MEMRKITAFVPTELLASAQAHTRAGVAETLKIALEQLSHQRFYDGMRELRGKIAFDMDLDALREDRSFDKSGDVT